jgi:hypothetical protein
VAVSTNVGIELLMMCSISLGECTKGMKKTPFRPENVRGKTPNS